MSIIKDPEYLPVFHHIAKNAGTYVLSWAQMLCRRYHILRGDNTQQMLDSEPNSKASCSVRKRQTTYGYLLYPDRSYRFSRWDFRTFRLQENRRIDR